MDREVDACDEASAGRREFVALEEPLQLTLDGHPVAVVMRTPGHDEELVRGFLLSEGIIASAGEVRRLEVEGNHARVFLHRAADLGRLRRNLFSASSCGICGKATIESILAGHPPIEAAARFPAAALLAAPARLREGQSTFSRTGGLHAAGLFDAAGRPRCIREDVGRHNAVDKVIGSVPPEQAGACFLMVSGRVSFEIMQKALAARIPLVAAISAPSSLAVEFARESGQALVAFLRPPRFNVYAGEVV